MTTRLTSKLTLLLSPLLEMSTLSTNKAEVVEATKEGETNVVDDGSSLFCLISDLAENAPTEQVAAVVTEEANKVKDVKAEEKAETKTEAPVEAAVESVKEEKKAAISPPATPPKDESCEEAKLAEGETKERNGALKVLDSIKRNLSQKQKVEKKDETFKEKSEEGDQESKGKVDKLVGRIFKRDEKVSPTTTEEKKEEEESAVEESKAAEEPVQSDKPVEEKNEEKEKGKHIQLLDQITKALSPRKNAAVHSESSSFEAKGSTEATACAAACHTTCSEAAKDEVKPAEESVVKEKKEEEAESGSPKMFGALRKRATLLIHTVEEKVSKDKNVQKETTEQSEEEVVASDVPVAAQPEVEEDVEQVVEQPASPKKESNKSKAPKTPKKEMVNHFIDEVKAKIYGVLSKEDKTKTEEVPQAGPSTENKAEEQEVASAEKKKEDFPVNELNYDASPKTENIAAAPASPSIKWKSRVSCLFTTPIAKKEVNVVAKDSTAEAATSNVTMGEPASVPAAVEGNAAAEEASGAQDGMRLAQIYLQTPTSAEGENKAVTA